MSSADLIREVKYLAKIDRDTELADRLGVGRANVSSWLRGTKPDAVSVLKLCEIGNLKPIEARLILEREQMQQAGFADIGLLAGISAVSLLAVSPLPYEQAITYVLGAASLYIM
ncbi:MAG TPA: helix-turn-helix domain-containing protein [Methylotenera sp.]|nr:helix-turn-helix domain-containing protein [Methylotenera sp.]